MTRRTADLLALARAHGIQPSFQDWKGVRRTASAESLIGGLRALGVELDDVAHAGQALRELEQRAQQPGIEPVHVAWDGVLDGVAVRCGEGARVCDVVIHLKSGEQHRTRAHAPGATRNGGPPRHASLDVGGPLPLGYHELVLEDRGAVFRSTVIAAPRRAAAPRSDRAWGAFMPLYAFGDPARGAGTYGELRDAAAWIGRQGGEFIGTLPVLAAFLDAPFEPSPYAPVSRLFWNDLFVDERDLPIDVPTVRVPHSGELVDYRAAAGARRAVLADAARAFFADGGARQPDFRAFAADHPRLDDYAHFRAACDHFRSGWPTWPAAARDGTLGPDVVDSDVVDYYRFTAWCADEQLASLGGGDAASLYLDLPLGVHPDGYDVWRERALFARDASAGAPPDALFVRGQDWGFPPLDPRALRASGYAYLIECLRHHLRRAPMLRLDHVMSLQRLYWIPRGLDATQGVYVRYPLDELIAVVALESARHEAAIVGEDLGTVSREIRTTMARHGIHRMFVVQYEAAAHREPPLPDVPRDVVASLNTHDMPPFAAYWRDLDLADQRALDLLDDAQLAEAHAERARLRRALARFFELDDTDDEAAARDALLGYLAASAARFVLVNIEDLWLETRPQNVPGTSTERPNWRRRARFTMDQLMREPAVAALLAAIDRQRRRAATGSRRHHENHA